MKQDRLEKYISEHIDAFDSHDTPPMVWDKINDRLGEKKNRRIRLFRMLKVAAVGFIVLSAGLLIGLQLANNDPTKSSKNLMEFVQAEQYYKNQVNVKWSEYQSLGVETNSVAEDLLQLDDIYKEMKNELLENPDMNSKKVINALIKNYRTKIDLLETVLDKTKNRNLSNLNINENELEKI